MDLYQVLEQKKTEIERVRRDRGAPFCDSLARRGRTDRVLAKHRESIDKLFTVL